MSLNRYFTNNSNLKSTLQERENTSLRSSPHHTSWRNPCNLCEKANRGIRYHSEQACWFKAKKIDATKNNNTSAISNVALSHENSDCIMSKNG